MMEEQPDDQIIVPCAHCGIPILTWWKHRQGGMLRGEYILFGDAVFHPRCLDRHPRPEKRYYQPQKKKGAPHATSTSTKL